MRSLEVRKYLFDIGEACNRLVEFTQGQDFQSYQASAMLRSAVERQFEIIGEALSRAMKLDPSLGGRIVHSARIVAFRNRLIHAYATIADEVVWGVLEADLPVLKRQIEELLKDDC